MESRTSSKSNLSESSSWDFDTMCHNTAKLDEMMISMKQGENGLCNVCNKQKDTLARREEIAWQREEIIHTREKELREWELMLQEKCHLLNEKEKKLKYKEEKVLQIESLHNSEKNSRKSSLSDIGHGALSLGQHMKENIKNEFVSEREKVLQEKEKIISEKIENLVKKEKSITIKEQQLDNQRILFNKEREFVAQKNHSLDLREQVVKKIEEAVEIKLTSIHKEKKSLDERNVLLTQKENAVSIATEYIQNKEQALNERENMIIEKERNIIQQICNLVKPAGIESPDEENTKLCNKFDEIFDEKWKSIQARENTVVNSEEILKQKWKEYSEAKAFLKSEEDSLQAIRDTFEKENNILREREKLLEKQEKAIEEKHELITGNTDNNRSFLGDACDRTWPSSLYVQTKTDLRLNRSSPFGAVGQQLNGDINFQLSDADKNADLSREVPNSENREISGDELFQFYEKEKESYHALLLKENADISTNTGESSNSEGNQELTEPVQAFLNKISISNLGENRYEQVDVPEINDKISQLSLVVHGERNKDEIVEDILAEVGSLNSQKENVVHSENQLTQDIKSVSSERSKFLPLINKESDKNNLMVSSGVEIDTTMKIMDKNVSKQSEIHKVVCKVGSTTQNNLESQNSQEEGSAAQDASCASPQAEKMKAESESLVKNGNDLCKTSGISYSRVSPAISVSSLRSLTSPISGRGSPSLGKSRKRPAKDALLQAISKRNFLETVQLLDTNCMSLEVRNNEGRSAALLAVECGNIDLVERLVNKGADIKACDYKGYSALHIAVAENNSDMVLFLLKKGLNPLITDINGNTAVKLASNLQFSNLSEVMNKYITATSK